MKVASYSVRYASKTRWASVSRVPLVDEAPSTEVPAIRHVTTGARDSAHLAQGPQAAADPGGTERARVCLLEEEALA